MAVPDSRPEGHLEQDRQIDHAEAEAQAETPANTDVTDPWRRRDDAPTWRTLSSAAGTNTVVHLLVTSCLYTCCGGGWRTRSGYDQTYRVQVVSVDADYAVFQSSALGKLTRILVEREHLVEARIEEN